MYSESTKYDKPIKAISIVDEYLEHARVWIFHNAGKERFFISSADWMLRNLEHRVEASCPIFDESIQKELKDILNIQLHDNVKARWLNNTQTNDYVMLDGQKIRAQVETYHYLFQKTIVPLEVSSN